MNLKEFKAMINAYHEDYDECEVGKYHLNDWAAFDYSVPVCEGKDSTVRIVLLFEDCKEVEIN